MEITELEKFLVNDSYEFKRKGGVLYATILDEELDPIEVCFNNDECALINTAELNFIALSAKQLKNLTLLIKKAKKIYESEDNDDELA
jgi:hypothetical protein